MHHTEVDARIFLFFSQATPLCHVLVELANFDYQIQRDESNKADKVDAAPTFITHPNKDFADSSSLAQTDFPPTLYHTLVVHEHERSSLALHEKSTMLKKSILCFSILCLYLTPLMEKEA